MDEQDAANQPEGRRQRRAPARIVPPETEATIGGALRAAREAAGLTLADVAERTKVRPGILTDIEADDHDRLPALTYTLGFVKAYARTVGLDPDAAADRYRQESHKSEPVPANRDLEPLELQRLPSRRLGWSVGVLLALALAGFWAWGAGWLTPANPPRPKTPVAGASPATGPVGNGAEAAGETPALPASAAPAADAVVTLKAVQEVWLKIADGPETFFMGTLQPGQVLTLPAGRDWRLRTGRAGALAVMVGTRQLPPLGGPVEQLKNHSLRPADLVAAAMPPTGGLTAPPLVGSGLAITPSAAPAAVPPAVPAL